MHKSKFISHYSSKFGENDIIECEKSILLRLNWELDQLTPFHFMQSLLQQEIIFECENIDNSEFMNTRIQQSISSCQHTDVEYDDSENLSTNIPNNSVIAYHNKRKNRIVNRFKKTSISSTDEN